MTELSILLKSSGESMIVGLLGGILAVAFFSVIGRINSGRDNRKLKREIEDFKTKSIELGIPDLYDRFVEIYQFLTTIIPGLSTQFVSDKNGIYGMGKGSNLVLITLTETENQYTIKVITDKNWSFSVNTSVSDIIETIKSDLEK